MSTSIPEEIKKKIEEKAFDCAGHINPIQVSRESAEFGYSLAQQELSKVIDHLEEGCNERDKEIQSLKDQVRAYKTLQETGDKIRAHQSNLLSEAKTVDSEREANAILTEEIERLNQEIQRLKTTHERTGIKMALELARSIIPVAQRSDQLSRVIGELERFAYNYGFDNTTHEQINDIIP